jgi:hypothetical protein
LGACTSFGAVFGAAAVLVRAPFFVVFGDAADVSEGESGFAAGLVEVGGGSVFELETAGVSTFAAGLREVAGGSALATVCESETFGAGLAAAAGDSGFTDETVAALVVVLGAAAITGGSCFEACCVTSAIALAVGPAGTATLSDLGFVE